MAAYPGCSQHEFGMAADATYLPITQITTKARPRVYSAADTNNFFDSAARHVSLTLVAGDPGHYQIYPGSQFKAWAVARGFCNPNPPPPDPTEFRNFLIERQLTLDRDQAFEQFNIDSLRNQIFP